MSERLSHEITQLLAEPDGGSRRQGRVDALARARLSAGIAEGLDESRHAGAAGSGDRMRLAALLDHGLSPAQRDAMLAALSQDPVGRAELSSAAELVDAVNSTSLTVPPQLLARAVETFGGEPLRDRPAVAPRRSAWPRRSSSRWILGFAAVLLVAVVTPAVLLVIGDRSDQGGEPTERGLFEQGRDLTQHGFSDSATGKKAAPEQKPATSCDDKGAAARRGEAGKPARTKSAPALADDPCQPKPPMLDGRATAPPPATRN